MEFTNNRKVIVHFVGLSGIGGVQSNFIEYMKNIELYPSEYIHKVYTFGGIDKNYQLPVDVLDIRKILNLYRLILDVISRDVIVHFYNNLCSLNVALFLFFLPVHKLIVHERGTIWNQPSSSWLIPSFIAWKASVVISNSFATKTMLIKKIFISDKKIRVLHNGINTSLNYEYGDNRVKSNTIFRVGFLGRLDSPKGVHVLIDAMHHLINEKIELVIAGEGVLSSVLNKRASKLNNIEFIGRIDNPYFFLNKIDLLVVPSIREPFGNVCLEAGLCKTPVVAANIDGIPEIIEQGVNGELIDAADKISINFPQNAVPLPEFVIDPISYKPQAPRQINSLLLANKILELSINQDKLTQYADGLHDRVVDYFNIERYTKELHAIYNEINL